MRSLFFFIRIVELLHIGGKERKKKQGEQEKNIRYSRILIRHVRLRQVLVPDCLNDENNRRVRPGWAGPGLSCWVVRNARVLPTKFRYSSSSFSPSAYRRMLCTSHEEQKTISINDDLISSTSITYKK